MSLKINDTAPNFNAYKTHGKINFYDWSKEKWVVIFSHPKNFTPVCTTELGSLQKIKKSFDERNVKILGLSFLISDNNFKLTKYLDPGLMLRYKRGTVSKL